MDINIRRQALEKMREEIQKRRDQANEDLRAIERLLIVQEETEPELEYSSVGEIRKAVIRELIGRGEEGLHRQVIMDRLAEKGINIRGKKPIYILGSILSRFSKDFESCSKGVWRTKWPASAQGGMAAMIEEAIDKNIPLAKLQIALEERSKLLAPDAQFNPRIRDADDQIPGRA